MEKSRSPDSAKKSEKSKRALDFSQDEVAQQETHHLTHCTRFRLSTEYELSICNCKHILKMTIGDRHSVANPQRWLCNTCYTTESVWACLSCPNVACGRYIHEHALNHFEESRHPLVIDVNELYVYCYECEEYVLNDNKSGDIKVLRETLQAIRYQNFTGTTRSGHTLRTATISADEDVQMRRRLQQQQLDRDDRLFTAIWHSRFVRQRKTFHAWLNFVRHRDEVADDVTEADGNVAAGTAAEKLQDACAPAAESNATSVIDVARVVGSNPDSESSVTGTASSSPCEKRSPVAAAKETKSAELSSGHKKLFDDISAVPCTVQTSPELKSEAVSPPVTPRPGSPGPAESPSVDDEATSVKQGGLVIVISEDEETASPKSDLDFASVTEPDAPAADPAPVVTSKESPDTSPNQRPKRANAGSRYYEMMTRLSDAEPSRKRVCPSGDHVTPNADDSKATTKQSAPRRSARLQQLLAKKRARSADRSRSRTRRKGTRASASLSPGAAKKRRSGSRLKKQVPPRTRVYRRVRSSNGTKSLYDSIPNRAVTSLIPGVTGLRNLGNTCYLNSIIQVLGHLQKFRRCLLAVRDLDVDEDNDSTRAGKHRVSPSSKLRAHGRRSTIELYETQQSSTPKKLLRLQEGLNGGNEEGSDKGAAVAKETQTPFGRQQQQHFCGNANQSNPLSLCHELHDLYHIMWSGKWKLVSPYHFLSSVWRLIPSFRGYSQQDAQEFLCELLDKIVSELDRKPFTPRNPAGLLSSRISRVVHAVFEGRLHSRVRCLDCQRVSSTHEPFWDLSLEFPQRYHSSTYSWKTANNKACTLQEMLEKFTEAEKLDGGRVYNCGHCNAALVRPGRRAGRERRLSNRAQKFTEAEKQMKINELPQILRFHLKRFRWSGRNHREKITVHVSFPAELDMSAHCWRDDGDVTSRSSDDENRFIYDLSAVVIHHGRGFGSGHYTAYCWNDIGKFWVHCNDSNLELCSIDDVMESQAYILFYSQRGIDPHPHLFSPPATPDLSPPPSPPFFADGSGA